MTLALTQGHFAELDKSLFSNSFHGSDKNYRCYFTGHGGGHTLVRMKLKALTLCRNPQSARLIGHALEPFDLQHDSCNSAQEAIELVTRGNYSVLILDLDSEDAAAVAKFARIDGSRRRPVIFGMLDAVTEVEYAFRIGVDFPLYKPLRLDQLTHSIRAAYGFIRQDRRRLARHAVETVVYLLFGKRKAVPTLMLDLNEDGLCVQAAEPLPSFEEVDIHFLLPGTRRPIEAKAELVWTDNGGRAGMLLSQTNDSNQRSLRKWLSRHSQNGRITSRQHPAAAFA